MSVLPTVRHIFQGVRASNLPKNLRVDQIVACWLVAGALLLEGSISPIPPTNFLLAMQVPIAEIPVQIKTSIPSKNFDFPQISAASYLVIDLDSASTLAASQAANLRYPASTLKLLTALTVLNHWSPEAKIKLTAIDLAPGLEIVNDLHWQVGEIITIRDLLAGLLIDSDNLSAQILVNHYPNGQIEFFGDMQALAHKLNLSPKLKINNAIGLDWADQLLSARDLTILAKAALTQPLIRQLVATKQLRIMGQLETVKLSHELINTNQLLWSDETVLGVKTGTTDLAGEVLITLSSVHGHSILTVVMNSFDRYQDTQKLLSWVKSHYRWQSWADVAYNDLSN